MPENQTYIAEPIVRLRDRYSVSDHAMEQASIRSNASAVDAEIAVWQILDHGHEVRQRNPVKQSLMNIRHCKRAVYLRFNGMIAVVVKGDPPGKHVVLTVYGDNGTWEGIGCHRRQLV